METSTQTGSQELDINYYILELGRNSVEEFNLDAGEVKVRLEGTAPQEPLRADAI